MEERDGAGWLIPSRAYDVLKWAGLIALPALATLVTTGEQLSAEQSFDFAACLPQGALLRHECALEQGRAGIQLHLHRASAALAQAKQLHDELESFYVPNMDFEKWQTMLDKTLESLKT